MVTMGSPTIVSKVQFSDDVKNSNLNHSSILIKQTSLEKLNFPGSLPLTAGQG